MGSDLHSHAWYLGLQKSHQAPFKLANYSTSGKKTQGNLVMDQQLVLYSCTDDQWAQIHSDTATCRAGRSSRWRLTSTEVLGIVREPLLSTASKAFAGCDLREEPVRCCMIRSELAWDWQSPLGSLKPQGAAQGANALV